VSVFLARATLKKNELLKVNSETKQV
jgi:hypothetical protein